MMMIVMKKVRFKQPHIATELIKYFSEEYGGVNFSLLFEKKNKRCKPCKRFRCYDPGML